MMKRCRAARAGGREPGENKAREKQAGEGQAGEGQSGPGMETGGSSGVGAPLGVVQRRHVQPRVDHRQTTSLYTVSGELCPHFTLLPARKASVRSRRQLARAAVGSRRVRSRSAGFDVAGARRAGEAPETFRAGRGAVTGTDIQLPPAITIPATSSAAGSTVPRRHAPRGDDACGVPPRGDVPRDGTRAARAVDSARISARREASAPTCRTREP